MSILAAKGSRVARRIGHPGLAAEDAVILAALVPNGDSPSGRVLFCMPQLGWRSKDEARVGRPRVTALWPDEPLLDR